MPTTRSHSWFPVLRAANSLAMMTIALCGMYAAVMVLEPATREFNIGRGAGALPYTMYMVGFGLGNIVLGRIADKAGIAVLSLLATVCLPAGLYFASQSHQLWLFVVFLSVFCGFLGGAFAFGPLVADISKWFDRRRGLAVGIVISGSYISGALWPPLLQFWFDTYGWRNALGYLALVCLVTMPPLCLIYFSKSAGPLESGENNDDLIWKRPLGLSTAQLQCALCFAGIGCCAAMAMPQIHIVPHSIDLGFEARDGANMLGLMLGFGIISRILSGWISDRIGGIKTLLLGSGLQGLVIFGFLFVDTLTGLYLISIAFGLSQGGIVPSYTLIIRRYFPASEAGSRIGLIFVSTIFGMALGGWLSGILYDLSGSYSLSFMNAIGFNLINFGIAAWLLSKRNRMSPVMA